MSPNTRTSERATDRKKNKTRDFFDDRPRAGLGLGHEFGIVLHLFSADFPHGGSAGCAHSGDSFAGGHKLTLGGNRSTEGT